MNLSNIMLTEVIFRRTSHVKNGRNVTYKTLHQILSKKIRENIYFLEFHITF